MNNHKTHLGREPYVDPNPDFDDGLYDVYKNDIQYRWSDAYVINAVLNGAQGPIRNQMLGE